MQESDLTREQRNLIDAKIGSRPVDKWRRDFANVRSRGGMAFGPRCRRLPLQNPLRHNRIPVAESDDPAGQRQVGLAEAAGGPREQFVVAAPGLTAEPGAAFAEVDQQAGGVNDGTKEQAAAVQLRPAPSVAPEQVLPSAGQVNGCETGYGRGVVCLPQTPPSHAAHAALTGEDLSRYWTCTEVRTLLPQGVVVDTTGSDPLALDSNGDGTACGVVDS